MSCTITIAEFKAQFDRGQFVYSAILPDVRDTDISKAITEALAIFNSDIYPTEAICKLALLYLTAHFLSLDIGAGDNGAQPVYNQTSRSVGSISESVQLPDWVSQSYLSIYMTTYYGQKWIALSLPHMVGGVYSVPGGTQF